MEIIVGLSVFALAIGNIAQTYVIFKLNLLYKSKDLREYVSLTEPKKEEKINVLPEEVEVPLY